MCKPPIQRGAGGCGASREPAKIQRVQFSVFECEVTPGDWVKLRARLLEEMDHARDSVRFYFLGADGKLRIEHAGNRKPVDLDGALIF
jgi:CRISPR-associated protein Cas2